jgi:hypothetical protein
VEGRLNQKSGNLKHIINKINLLIGIYKNSKTILVCDYHLNKSENSEKEKYLQIT